MAKIDRVKLADLMAALASADGVERGFARRGLVTQGKAAVPFLIDALSDRRDFVRREAAQALEGIASPAAAPALVKSLLDEESGVRWLAARALIALKHRALEPLLEALIKHADSGWMCEGAAHALTELSSLGEEELAETLAPVLSALADVAPDVEAPLAASKALDRLKSSSPPLARRPARKRRRRGGVADR